MAGGGQLPGRATNITSAEIYSPPYLFKGARPTITSAPSLVNYGSSFTVSTPDAAAIQKVALIRTPSVTHAFDENQRYIPLSFTTGSGQLTVQTPSNVNTAPPGYYMLFIVNAAGVPSVASIVHFPTASQDTQPPSAPAGLTAAPGSGGTVTLTWSAATDNVGVTRYDVYRSTVSGFTPSLANRIAQPTGTTYQDAGLAAGTYFYVVKAEDAVANLSAASSQATATIGSSDTTPPSVAISSPGGGATLTGTVTVTATASDDVGVAGVQFTLDGANLGVEDTTAPYSVTWNTAATTNGTHTLTAVARDAAGNTTTSAAVAVTVANTAPPPSTYLFGDQTIEAGNDSNVAGVAEAFQTTSATTGTLRKLTVYVAAGSAATTVVAGLYADNGGHPGALLAQGTLAAPAAGAWNDITVPTAAVTSGARYWIALLSPNGSGILRFRDRCCTTGGAETSQQIALAGLPATWTTGQRFSTTHPCRATRREPSRERPRSSLRGLCRCRSRAARKRMRLGRGGAPDDIARGMFWARPRSPTTAGESRAAPSRRTSRCATSTGAWCSSRRCAGGSSCSRFSTPTASTSARSSPGTSTGRCAASAPAAATSSSWRSRSTPITTRRAPSRGSSPSTAFRAASTT